MAKENEVNIISVVGALETAQQLETLGQTLTLDQLTELMQATIENNHLQPKLAPIFVGLPPSLFQRLMLTLQPELLKVLKQEAVTESIQHQLTLLSHNTTIEITTLVSRLANLTHEINALSLEEMGWRERHRLEQAIQQLAEETAQVLQIIKTALAIAWNTNRKDLIDQLSLAKESCQKIFIDRIGQPAADTRPDTGLWATLAQKLNTAFQKDPSQSAPSDEEPALEAFVHFSIWYLKDYWEIGLLPDIHTEKALELSPGTHSEQDRLAYREKLFATVENNLAKLGLNTLKDIKAAHIYSKKGLAEYIKERLAGK